MPGERTMKKNRVLWTSICLLLLGVGFACGFLTGYTRAFWLGMERQRAEVTGSLFTRVEILSSLRIGEKDRAIALIEGGMDQAIRTLPMLQDYRDLPVMTQRALTLAKVYRTTYPSDAPDIAASLAPVPLIPAEQCSSSLSKVAEMAKQNGI